ncbi:hypothetical protein KA005_36390 [bacterium]|nr:hypothetical protein [bacterium]
MKKKFKILFGIILFITLFLGSISLVKIGLDTGVITIDKSSEYKQGYYDGFVKGQNELNETNRAFWLSITDETSENFYRMRDLFTPMYNDSVTVEKAGYISGYESLTGSWISGGVSFWVNHTRVLNSYYFEDKQSYRVVFPMSGMIYVVN